MLQTNLERQGVDLAVDANVAYFDVTNRRVGINKSSPGYTLDVNGNARIANLLILGNTITSNTGVINLGSTNNITISGGSAYNVMITDGKGNLSFTSVSNVITSSGAYGNTIQLGANVSGALVSNAVTLTTSTSVTDGLAQINYVLGKLVPPSPPPFPGNATAISVGGLTAYGRMCNFTQTDNTATQGHNITGGTSFSSLRTATYSTSGTPVLNVGPGTSGTVTAYLNGVANGNVTLNGSNSNTTNGNLYVYNVQDYHNFLSTVTGGFWTAFSTYATGTVPGGWNEVYIYDSYTNTSTNTTAWYYDSSAPGAPTWANTSISLVSNAVVYSSTIPMFTSAASFKIKGNVAKLSGDQYYSSDTFVTGAAGGAFQTPASVTYTQAGVTTPLARNLYVSSGSAYLESAVNITTGFGSSATGPTLTAFNSYSSTSSGAITPGVTILYKTGTANTIEETAIPVSASLGGTYATNGARIIITSGSTDTPAYTGSDSYFDSTLSALQTYDATVVANTIKWDNTNYSTGYLPVGPNLSGRGAGAQYFTFKFQRTVVSKFDIVYTGTIAGLWIAAPGTSLDTSSTLNGWLDCGTAYGGSGNPGAGTGGNGSNGCAVSGNAVFNSAQTNKAVTATLGGVSSSSATSNEIYVRIKLTSGQSLTALSITTPSH